MASTIVDWLRRGGYEFPGIRPPVASGRFRTRRVLPVFGGSRAWAAALVPVCTMDMTQRPANSARRVQAGLRRPVTSAQLHHLENANRDKLFTCLHICPEVTSLCPVTNAPDFATLRIEYEPAAYLVELKSLRDYLVAFRGVETYHEELLNRIFDDFVHSVEPTWVSMELQVAVRGGIESRIIRSNRPTNGSNKALYQVTGG